MRGVGVGCVLMMGLVSGLRFITTMVIVECSRYCFVLAQNLV